MLHKQRCQVEHWRLNCPVWLQGSKHIGQAPECGFWTQSSTAALQQTSQEAHRKTRQRLFWLSRSPFLAGLTISV